ncbi:sigma-54-dependent Fis family transcriptional regulator [bacterium]|nr:sigma-54-dependent Fis family transcriptional regulator [bacterium]
MEKIKANILVIDDEKIIRTSLDKFLSMKGFCVRTVQNTSETLSTLQTFSADVILLDLMLGKENGLELLKKINDENAIIIMMTAYGTVKTAVDAVKSGAYEYITKPYDIEELLLIIERGLNSKKNNKLLDFYKKKSLTRYTFDRIVSESPAMKKAVKLMQKGIEKNVGSILLSGESGTGKDFLSKVIHYNSFRSEQPFFVINLAALPENLIESELFGYSKGSFTGAEKDHTGMFELAHNGTLLLDEITEFPYNLQAKLLRAIENKEIKKVGSEKIKVVDVNLIFASNRNLKDFTSEKKLRRDLFYRINSYPITIPPLRERKEDVIGISQNLLEDLSGTFNVGLKHFSSTFINHLLSYHWPGNIRELKNFIERNIILNECDDDVLRISEEIQQPVTFHERKIDSLKIENYDFEGKTLDDIEKLHITETLRLSCFNISKAARSLGVGRGALRYKIKKHGITLHSE